MSLYSRNSSRVLSLDKVERANSVNGAVHVRRQHDNKIEQLARRTSHHCCAICLDHSIELCLSTERIAPVKWTKAQTCPSMGPSQCMVPSRATTVSAHIADRGVPLRSLLNLFVNLHEIHDVDVDCESLLFFANTESFRYDHCICTQQHESTFECLIRYFEARSFESDRLDFNGRSSLTYLCSASSFRLSWLVKLMQTDSQWKSRVWRLSQLRDSDGLFLYDFLALNPDFPSMSEHGRFQFHIAALCQLGKSLTSRVLPDEDERGRTALHKSIQIDYFDMMREEPLPFISVPIVSDINRYNYCGNTHMLEYLQVACHVYLDEDEICKKVRYFISVEVNPNTRARDGGAVLHFAAKASLSKFLKILLTSGIVINHRDVNMRDAAFYSARAFNRSRNAKKSIDIAARSLKFTANLMSAASLSATWSSIGRSQCI